MMKKSDSFEKQYFLGLDALFFQAIIIPQEEQENLEPKNTAKVTVSANWSLLYLKGLGHEEIKEAAGFPIFRSSSNSIVIIKKYKFLAVNANRTPIA